MLEFRIERIPRIPVGFYTYGIQVNWKSTDTSIQIRTINPYDKLKSTAWSEVDETRQLTKIHGQMKTTKPTEITSRKQDHHKELIQHFWNK